MNSIIRTNIEILERIVFKNDQKVFDPDFYKDQILIDQGYKFVNQMKDDLIFQAYVKIPKDKNLDIDIIHYGDYIEYRLKRLFSDMEQALKSEEHQSETSDDLQNVLIETSNEIVYLFKKSLAENERIAEHITEFSDFLKIRYYRILNDHPVLNLKMPIKNLSIGFFQPQPNLKMFFFKNLYEISIEYRIFDLETCNEEDFIDVLTDPQPSKSLKFNCNNYIAVYFLDQIAEFFLNLNPASIGRSKLFFTKQNRPFTESNLNASRSRGNNKFLIRKTEIRESIDDLKLEFLS